MSTATQSIRSSPLPPLTRYDPVLSSSSRHISPREQPLQFTLLESASSERGLSDDEKNRQLLIGHRVCHRCKSRIEVAPTLAKSDPVKLLHSTCSTCSATQCRGCSAPKPQCGPRCDERICRADPTACCARSRAIAIFEVLSEFDKEYSAYAARLSQTATWPVPRRERRDFLELVTSRADATLSNRFNRLLGATVNMINKCLLPETPENAVDPAIRPLLTSSFLFEAIYAYLRHDCYINWAINARDVYVPVMTLLQLLGNRRSLSDLVMVPSLPSISVSPGVQVCVWYHDEPMTKTTTTVWASDGHHPESLFSAAFSNGAQQCIADLEKVLERRGSSEPTAQIRIAFYKLLLLDIIGASLP